MAADRGSGLRAKGPELRASPRASTSSHLTSPRRCPPPHAARPSCPQHAPPPGRPQADAWPDEELQVPDAEPGAAGGRWVGRWLARRICSARVCSCVAVAWFMNAGVGVGVGCGWWWVVVVVGGGWVCGVGGVGGWGGARTVSTVSTQQQGGSGRHQGLGGWVATVGRRPQPASPRASSVPRLLTLVHIERLIHMSAIARPAGWRRRGASAGGAQAAAGAGLRHHRPAGGRAQTHG